MEDKAAAATLFTEVGEAWEVLGDEEMRKQYATRNAALAYDKNAFLIALIPFHCVCVVALIVCLSCCRYDSGDSYEDIVRARQQAEANAARGQAGGHPFHGTCDDLACACRARRRRCVWRVCSPHTTTRTQDSRAAASAGVRRRH